MWGRTRRTPSPAVTVCLVLMALGCGAAFCISAFLPWYEVDVSRLQEWGLFVWAGACTSALFVGETCTEWDDSFWKRLGSSFKDSAEIWSDMFGALVAAVVLCFLAAVLWLLSVWRWLGTLRALTHYTGTLFMVVAVLDVVGVASQLRDTAMADEGEWEDVYGRTVEVDPSYAAALATIGVLVGAGAVLMAVMFQDCCDACYEEPGDIELHQRRASSAYKFPDGAP